MKAYFVSKPADLENLNEELDIIAENLCDYEPIEYHVAANIEISDDEWEDLTNGFLKDREWIHGFNMMLAAHRYRFIEYGTVPVIKVTNRNHASLLIDPQGYNYARYVAIQYK